MHELILLQFVVVEPGKPAWKKIVDNFGLEILLQDGHLDRQKLGQIIFQDEAKRKILNRCTHPFIQRAMIWQVAKHFLMGKYSSTHPCPFSFPHFLTSVLDFESYKIN